MVARRRPLPPDFGRALELRAAAASGARVRSAAPRQSAALRVVDAAAAAASQVTRVAALSGGRILSGSDDFTLKLWDAVEAKMAVRVWHRKMLGSNEDAVKHIVKFL